MHDAESIADTNATADADVRLHLCGKMAANGIADAQKLARLTGASVADVRRWLSGDVADAEATLFARRVGQFVYADLKGRMLRPRRRGFLRKLRAAIEGPHDAASPPAPFRTPTCMTEVDELLRALPHRQQILAAATAVDLVWPLVPANCSSPPLDMWAGIRAGIENWLDTGAVPPLPPVVRSGSAAGKVWQSLHCIVAEIRREFQRSVRDGERLTATYAVEYAIDVLLKITGANAATSAIEFLDLWWMRCRQRLAFATATTALLEPASDSSVSAIPVSALDDWRIAEPCHVRLSATDDPRVMACATCGHAVYNIAEMTRAEVDDLIRTHEGRFCAMLFRMPDGRVMTRECATAKPPRFPLVMYGRVEFFRR